MTLLASAWPAALVRYVVHPLGVQSALLSSTLHGHPASLDQAAVRLRHSRFSVGALTLGLLSACMTEP